MENQAQIAALERRIAELERRLVTIGHEHLASHIIDLPVGGGGGVMDHGDLTGLSDDDHSQYLNTSRGDARYPLLAHSHAHNDATGKQGGTTGQYYHMTAAEYAALGGSGGGGVLYDTYANRPSASSAGDGALFAPTDSYPPAISNGSNWKVRWPHLGFECSDPADASTFTKVGGGAETTLVDHGDGLVMTMMGLNSSSLQDVVFLKALPSPPYEFIVGLSVLELLAENYMQLGVCLSDGTTTGSKFTDLVYQNGSGGNYFMTQKFSALNTWSAHYSSQKTALWTEIFLRIKDDNTNRYYHWSRDCIHWELLYSCGRTDYLTPTHCGLWCSQGTGTIPTTKAVAQMKIHHWSLA